MLKLYDYLDAILQSSKLDPFFENEQLFFASDVFDLLGISDEGQKKFSIRRAFQSCVTLSLPLNRNFKHIYRFGNSGLISDWQVSALGCYLIIINCDPKYEQVAKAQLFFAIKNLKVRTT
jgi:prophage antirepressor-like protein